MKLLFLNTNIGYGGASKMMVWVANLMAENGHDVTFVTYRDGKCSQKLSSKIDFKFIPLEPESGKGKGMLNTLTFLRSFIKDNKFDVAIGFLTPSQFRLGLACVGLKTKCLFSQRGDPYSEANNFAVKINRKVFSHADYYVFQTVAARNFYSKKIQNRSMVISNPIKPLLRRSLREGNVEKRIVCVGRLDIRQKRQDLLIEAFNLISPNFPDYTLELYGDGQDENVLKQMAASNPQIVFKGKTSDVATVIENAAISVLSSDFEGIPNALLEAMSIGVPCVSTDCSPGGAAMLIENGKNGLLVPRNNKEALAEAMKYMLDNPAEAERMGKNAMAVNERFSEEAIAKQWLDCINRLK